MPITTAEQAPTPNALGVTTVNLRTRLTPEPLMEHVTNDNGTPLYKEVKTGKTVTRAETVVKDVDGTVIRTYQNEPITEEVKDADGNTVFDYADLVQVTQQLVDDTKKGKPGFNAGSRTGDESELPPELQAKWAALIVETREFYATATGFKLWPDI